MKPFADLKPANFRHDQVWEFCNDLDHISGDETLLRPVKNVPVDDLANRVVGGKLRIANGEFVAGILSNINLGDSKQTEHFLTVTLYRDDGRMFHLARYHDFNIETHGPKQCAAFFDLAITELFPIAYDLTNVVIGHSMCVRGTIPAQPKERLDDDELIRMAVSG